MTNTLDKPEGRFAIWAGPGLPKEADFHPMSEMNAVAREAGIVLGPDGDNIADLVPVPESADTIFARFNRKPPPMSRGDIDDISDLIPKPEAAAETWARFNGRAKAGPTGHGAA